MGDRGRCWQSALGVPAGSQEVKAELSQVGAHPHQICSPGPAPHEPLLLSQKSPGKGPHPPENRWPVFSLTSLSTDVGRGGGVVKLKVQFQKGQSGLGHKVQRGPARKGIRETSQTEGENRTIEGVEPTTGFGSCVFMQEREQSYLMYKVNE